MCALFLRGGIADEPDELEIRDVTRTSKYTSIEQVKEDVIKFATMMQEKNRTDMYNVAIDFLRRYMYSAVDATVDLYDAENEYVDMVKLYSTTQQKMIQSAYDDGSTVVNAFEEEYKKLRWK